MSGNASLFTEIKKKGHRSVTFGDKSTSKIIGIEKIDKDPSNLMGNVYLVDGLRVNLLSISQLCDKGNLVTFDFTNCIIKNRQSGKVTLYGPIIENVYVIHIDNLPSHNLSCLKISHHEENWLWHKRLGHASMHTINKLAKRELVRGLPSCVF